jgi:hypothetical protein
MTGRINRAICANHQHTQQEGAGTAIMQRRYMLPVRAILQTLTGQNGITALSATLPSVPGHPHHERKALLILGAGQVQSCTIQTHDGRALMQGGEALKKLEQFAQLEWHVQEAPGDSAVWPPQGYTPSREQEQFLEEQRIPHRRVAQLSPAQQQTLSHRARQVFALADGLRSVASIATLLHLPPGEVIRLLQALQHNQLID